MSNSRHLNYILKLSLSVVLTFCFAFTPLHFSKANPSADGLANNALINRTAQETTSPLIDSLNAEALSEVGLPIENLKTFQHKYSGTDYRGVLKDVVVDYIGGDLTLEQTYRVLEGLKPQIDADVRKNPKATVKVNVVKNGFSTEEVISLKNMYGNLEILNPHYLEHSASESTQMGVGRIFREYTSSRYQTAKNKFWSVVRFVVNGSVVGYSIFHSYLYIPAAVAVGVSLGAASGLIQYYIEAFSQFLVNTKTRAGEFARWYALEVPVSAIIPVMLYVGFNISPEAGQLSRSLFEALFIDSFLSQRGMDFLAKTLEIMFVMAPAAMGAQGTWDVYLSNKKNIVSREIAIGTKHREGENSKVFQRGELLGVEVFRMDTDLLRKQLRPGDYKLKERTSFKFVGVSMAWAMLAVITLAGENIFPGKANLGLMELSYSSVIGYGGFAVMGAAAVMSSRYWNKQRLKRDFPEWSKTQISQALTRMRKEFWSFMFLDKSLVATVKASHPDWSIEEVKREVIRLSKDRPARQEAQNEVRRSEKAQPDLFESINASPEPTSCRAYFR